MSANAPLPKKLQVAVTNLRQVLDESTTESVDVEDAVHLYGLAVDEVERVLEEVRKKVLSMDPGQKPLTTFDLVSREQMRLFRIAADVTQKALASSMDSLGFGWQRSTVADVEGGRRGLSLTEVAALAMIFEKPMVSFLLSNSSVTFVGSDEAWTGMEDADIQHEAFTSDEALDLLIGSGGTIGRSRKSLRDRFLAGRVQPK